MRVPGGYNVPLTLLLWLLLLTAPDAAGATDAASPPISGAPPKPLARDAVTSDWPRFLGPTDDAHSPETRLARALALGDPPVVWEAARGEGYASPVVAGDRLVLFHRVGGREVI